MIKAPFPYFGGKSTVADLVWSYLGPVDVYNEPFCGSAAMLLGCPYDLNIVNLNDANGFIANFWRSVSADPDAVAKWLDRPVNEIDLFAIHVWLVKQGPELVRRLEIDPDYYDAKIAGWWCWGACAWIGSGWCSGEGPWTVEDGQIVNLRANGDAGRGVNRKLPHLGTAGRGVNRQRPHLGDAGQGIYRQRPHTTGSICADYTTYLHQYMANLKDALRRPRVCCGDWKRVVDSETVTTKMGVCGVFFDPPYGDEADRDMRLYSQHDSGAVAAEVRQWCLANGDRPQLRIALCGYDIEHTELEDHGWTKVRWKANGGQSNQSNGTNKNRFREVIWFSPHCLNPLKDGKRLNGKMADLSHLPMFGGQND